MADSEIQLKSNNHGNILPLYDDAINKSSSSPLQTSIPGGHKSNTNAPLPVYVDKTVAEDSQALYDFILEQARLPPQVLLHIRQDPCGGRYTPDFNFKIDLTSTLFRLDPNDAEWNELTVVRDGDGKEAYRGGWYKSLKWEHGSRFGGLRTEKDSGHTYSELGSESPLEVNENGSNEEASLMAWCERFCHDPAVGKSFTFQRNLGGFDQESLRAEADWYLRSMNYEGGCITAVQILNTSVKVYSPHWYSHIRESIFIKPLRFFLSPVFTYLEGRYEVVCSMWWSSRRVKDTEAPTGFRKVYAHGRNEAQVVDFWSATIAQAIRDKQKSGRVLGLEYLESLQERTQERVAHLGPFLPENNATGSSTAGRTRTSCSNPPRGWGGHANTAGP